MPESPTVTPPAAPAKPKPVTKSTAPAPQVAELDAINATPVLEQARPAESISREDLLRMRALHVPADAEGNLQISSLKSFAVNRISLRNVQTGATREVLCPPNMPAADWPIYTVPTPNGNRRVEQLVDVNQDIYKGDEAEFTVQRLLSEQRCPYTGRNYGYGYAFDPLARGEAAAKAVGGGVQNAAWAAGV